MSITTLIEYLTKRGRVIMKRALSRWLLILALGVIIAGGLWTGTRTSHAAPATWYVQIYDTTDWTGPASEDPAVAGTIDYVWGGAPTVGTASSANTDGFSVRFTGQDTFVDGVYRFTLTGDERPQLLIDGVPYINTTDWPNDSTNSITRDILFAAGNHTVTVQMKDVSGNAVIQLTYPAGPLPRPIHRLPQIRRFRRARCLCLQTPLSPLRPARFTCPRPTRGTRNFSTTSICPGCRSIQAIFRRAA